VVHLVFNLAYVVHLILFLAYVDSTLASRMFASDCAGAKGPIDKLNKKCLDRNRVSLPNILQALVKTHSLKNTLRIQ